MTAGGALARRRCVPALLALALGLMTLSRSRAFRDDETLWRDTLTRNPRATLAYRNLGGLLIDQGRIDEAVSVSRRAVEAGAVDPEVLINLGYSLNVLGRPEEALPFLEGALRLAPGHAIAHYDIGVIERRRGNRDLAESRFRRALAGAPPPVVAADAHLQLGELALEAGRRAEAIDLLTQALAIDPGKVAARRALAAALRGE